MILPSTSCVAQSLVDLAHATHAHTDHKGDKAEVLQQAVLPKSLRRTASRSHLCVHNKGPILRYRLPNWLSSNQQKPKALLVIGGGCHMVSRAKHQGMLAGALCAADSSTPNTYIRKAIPPPRYLTTQGLGFRVASKKVKCACDHQWQLQ